MFSNEVQDLRPVNWRARLLHRAAFRWYPGATVGLLYQISVLVGVWASGGSLATKLITTALLVVVYLGFLVLPPLLWWEGERVRYAGIAAYFAFTLVLFPLIGTVACWTWVYVACVAGMVVGRAVVGTSIIVGLGGLQLIVLAASGTIEDYWFIALVTVSIGIMMSAFARQIDALRKLRNAQGEIARLAVIEERARFSRDMHDVLGHSLTVVTVKSELARRLVPVDPARAEEELADIERLTRSALADLRAAVAGYREMTLSTELAAAQAGLAAANIHAHLPRNGEEVAPELRELFGWVLREGVTNVIRHSGARNCWVTVLDDRLDVEDDGRGPAPVGALEGAAARARRSGSAGGGERSGGEAGGGDAGGDATRPGSVHPAGESAERPVGWPAAVAGSGLAGLTARAREAGAVIAVGPGPRGGTLLTVRRVA